jgi:lysozyme
MTIIEQLKRDEGCRLRPYRDSVGKLTIGIGRNLDDVGISQDEADMLLHNDLGKVFTQLSEQIPWIADLDEARQGVLENMCFNMGIHGLMGFKNTLALIQAGEYDKAADAMLESHWAEQVGPRAQRLALQMRRGEWQ